MFPVNEKNIIFAACFNTEVVAQLVRASDCGSEGRGFDPRHPPQKVSRNPGHFFYYLHPRNVAKISLSG